MEKIKWTPDLSVGVSEIDEQHQKLYSIIDELIKAQKDVLDKKAILVILTQLVDYSDYHFRTEDNYMIENNYPLFLSHRKEHLAYIKKMGTLIDDLENKRTTVTVDILEFLCEWWQNHISQSDMKYARYIKAQKAQT
ncbi:MAG: bacteriohemerythrin [Desulfobacteraceae bacterium]|jgi:hemerythrin